MKEHNNDITAGIETILYRSLRKAIYNNSKETFFILSNFIRKVLNLAIANNSIDDFRKYIYMPANFYTISYQPAKENILFNALHKICAKQSASNLTDIIWYISLHAETSKTYSIEDFNQFYYHAFSGFSQLFYSTVQNVDIDNFKMVISEYEKILSRASNEDYTFQNELSILKLYSVNDSNDLAIKELKDSYLVKDKPNIYSRHVIICIKYWIYFLFSEKIINEDITKELLNLIRFDINNTNNSLKDILSFKSNSFHYLGWEDWDYIERPTGVVYSPISPNSWLTLGFMADQIRHNSFNIDIDNLDFEELTNAQYLYSDLKSYEYYFINNFELWNNILKVESFEQLKTKTENILSQIIQIKRKVAEKDEKIIANLPLSNDRINKFKELVGEAWYKQAKIHKLFYYFNATQLVDSSINLTGIFSNRFFTRGKSMFLEEPNFEHVHGIETIGIDVANREDDLFFHFLLNTDCKKIYEKNIIDVINSSLIEFRNSEVTPTLIIISYEFSRWNSLIINDSKFVKSKNQEIPNLIGTYANVPVYVTDSNLLNNQIIISNFDDAFVMEYQTDHNWYKGELSIDVRNVSDEEASIRLNKEPEKWKYIEEGIVISDEDAITLIQNSVYVKIGIKNNFKIINQKSIIFGIIEP